MFRKNRLFVFLIVALMLIMSACSNSTGGGNESSGEKENNSGGEKAAENSGKLVIYTARDQTIVDQVVGMFNEKYPDIQVDVLTMGAQQVLERIRGEKSNPQADFWWGGTQSAFMTGAAEDLLEPFKPSFDASILPEHKDKDGRWYGEMLLPEVIMINSDMLSKEEAPQDWDDLLDPKWKDQIIIRGVLASGTMRTIYSAMIHEQGADNPEAGYEWLSKLDANTKEYAQDPTNLYLKLARQEGSISLWNLQDILLQKNEHNQPFDFVYPESGAPILVDAVGLVKGAKNLENAKVFYEFLFDPETRATLAEDLYQIPTRTDIDKDQMPDWFKDIELKSLDLDWGVMAEKEAEWMQHWDENIKGKN
ncbi:extracellular solute-binding protein [Cytobacillus solani]|uniref:Iron ABC transporter substrate-binding protein n=1 Tax=Cytobacillus solani TaxID=1637975 RepID=A0A0Q3SP80_9BACI|nr:extracellular solute-binding protein [Cytobacillus solani]KOP71951.1 iron ABC transporter substrate-binding protein [Bacillus sp. FJAT-21945]KQL21388.1 iron ABC transporter substrate-binding protein [Cytobacillus solani]USK54683.1 extracellular solute-binding protein [Cytobacillus solani]